MRLSEEIEFPGATLFADGRVGFKVFAPNKKTIRVLLGDGHRTLDLGKSEDGYFTGTVEGVTAGGTYTYLIDGHKRSPDPASQYQPEGVHGPSMILDHNAFVWTDAHWHGLSFRDVILYELHVGTFTPEGTFEAIIPRLDELADTGINALELMPVSQFSGHRNWGYDGVFPYAVQNTYGGPDGLKKLVNACHEKGIAVLLDVVYNHLGPEGNCFAQFSSYFTDKYSTPWGAALNFDGEWSDGVRDIFSANPVYWFKHFHLDGLRLDAVHMLFDNSAVHFWQEANNRVKDFERQSGRTLHMIAESDFNSPRVVDETSHHGLGFTGQWLDDFHHSLYVMLDPAGRERYVDFGLMEQLAKAFERGFVHSGEFVKFRKRRHGVSSAHVPGYKFVAFNLNHDQVGNRPHGERLSVLVNFDRLKLAAAALMLSPYIPMLFMGEEYGEVAPFYYFVSHSDPELIEAVRKGRKEEFKDFPGSGELPDAQDEETFRACFLQWKLRKEGWHKRILDWHKHLIALRRRHTPLRSFEKYRVKAVAIGQDGLVLQRQSEDSAVYMVAVFNFSERQIKWVMPAVVSGWRRILDSLAPEWCEDGTVVSELSSQVAPREEIRLEPLQVCAYEGLQR